MTPAPLLTPLLTLLLTLAAPALAQPEPGPAPDLSSRLEQAWKANDTAQLASILDDAWTNDPVSAKKRTLQVLASDSDLFRPAAIAALGRHADAETLASVIRSTNRRAVGERRWLTYALSDRPKEESAEHLTALLRDQDLLIRAAAATGLARLKDPALLEPLLPLLREHPAWKPESSGDDQHSLQMALFGAIENATHQRPASSRDAKAALASLQDSPPSTPDPDKKPERFSLRGKTFLILPRFNLSFDLGPAAQISDARVRQLEKEVFPVADRMNAAATKVFGPLLPASVRLIIADQQRFSGYAGNSFRPGVSQGNQVVLREMSPELTEQVLGHEYIHVLHEAAFPKQPRWLMEGMAESISLSTAESVWNLEEVRRAGLERDVSKAVFAAILNWDGAASSGDQETRLYRLAHMAVDSLRFGPYGDRDVRLFLMMSRIGEGENPNAVLKSLYGADPRELDRRLQQWLAR
jgi:hypothetical protein